MPAPAPASAARGPAAAGAPFTVLVLGGYGHFGGRIARRLAADGTLRLLVAGRDAARAQAFASRIAAPPAPFPQGIALDTSAPDLAARLRDAGAQLVIHAAGPFQGLDYGVARACIAAGVHYVDLADSRAFVAGFGVLDAPARAAGVLCVTGASTLPAVSAAAADVLAAGFTRIDAIDSGISIGNRTERGLATVQAILSYTGKPFPAWRDGRWGHAHGWQELRREDYGGAAGRRWLACCDVPDLELFPARYGVVREVSFRAGLELAPLHLGLWLLSWLARARLLRLAPLARTLKWLSERWSAFGSDVGAMHLRLSGADASGAPRRRTWRIEAGSGHGPEIPCTPAVLLAQRLAAGTLPARGALACMGLLGLAEIEAGLRAFDVRTRITQD